MPAGIAVLGFFVALSLPVAGSAAQSTTLDFDPGLAAKLAKEKVKQRGPRRRSSDQDGGRSGDDEDECGTVNIGNSGNNGGRQSAAQRFRERNRTVIVTGPVINAARCR